MTGLPDERLADASAWRELCASIERLADRVRAEDAPDSPRDRAEGYRYLLP